MQHVRICQLSNSYSEFILWRNRRHHITAVSPTVATVSSVSSAAINPISWPESGSLDHQGSVGVNTTSTGSLDHQKEEAFRPGLGGPMLDASRLACQHHRLILLTISVNFCFELKMLHIAPLSILQAFCVNQFEISRNLTGDTNISEVARFLKEHFLVVLWWTRR